MSTTRRDGNSSFHGAAWRGALARVGIDLRPGEGSTAALLFLTFFLMVTFQYVAKTVRQSTFIDSLGATRLPWVYLLLAICSYPLLRVYVKFAERLPRHRLIAGTCWVVLLSMIVFWWLFRLPGSWIPAAFYVWVSIAFVMTVSQFWSFANHVYDARQAKRLFGLIGAGGLLGGVAGGQVARLTDQLVGTRHALLVAAAMLFGVVLLIRWVHHARPESDSHGPGATGMGDLEHARGGSALLRGSRHLQLIALVLVLAVMAGQIIDLQFNWAVEQATSGLGERTAFYGNFFSVVSIAAFAFQLFFTSRIHRTMGVGFAMRVAPVGLGLGTAFLLLGAGAFPEILVGTALGLKVGESGLRYSLDQSTRELLFLPLPSSLRVKAKAFIDVFLQRSAKGLAALLLLPVTFGLMTAVQAGWIALVLTVMWFLAAGAAYRAYVTSFRDGLKRRSVDTVVPIDLADVKTVELLVQSLGSTDARQVLHSLDILEANDRGNLVPPLLLYHDDPEVRRRTLQVLAGVGRRDAASLVERRLADDDPEVRAEAIRVLTEFSAGDACELMLPRLSEPDPRVRAAAVTCLVNHGHEAAVAVARKALMEMLSDAGADNRAEAVKAIGAIRDHDLEGRLLEALYDREPAVAREAILAVQRIVKRDGFSPLYAPRLISLLQNRRLKHDAREALLAFGEDSVPILVHFMNDPGESIWVRRSLPKALARIGGSRTVEALLDSLLEADDAVLRSQLVEALAMRRDDLAALDAGARIEQAIRAETVRYMERLTDVAALGGDQDLRFEAPLVRWDTRELNLLTQMVAERIEEHVKTLFGLLALSWPPHDVWAAFRSLLSGRSGLRAHALEYLDNTLSGEVRRNVFAVIDDEPLAAKLDLGRRTYGVTPVTLTGSVRRFLHAEGSGAPDGPALTVAALYSVYTDRMAELYPITAQLAAENPNPLVQETASWVASRLDSEAAPPTQGEPR